MPSKVLRQCLECQIDFRGAKNQQFCSQGCARKSREKRRKTLECIECKKEFIAHMQSSRLKCFECKPACASGRGRSSYKASSCVQLTAGGSCYVCEFCMKECLTPASLGGHIRIHFRVWDELRTDGTRKQWLLREHGHLCWICKNSEWMGKPIPLELDHIDGHSENSSKENLRIVCPNCHAQTPTYKAKNKGRGSKARVKMYESMRLRASMQ